MSTTSTLFSKFLSKVAPKAAVRWEQYRKVYHYITAGSRPSVSSLSSINLNVDKQIHKHSSKFLGSARQLYAQNTIVQSIIRRMKTNTIGSGLKLQSGVDHTLLGISEAEAIQWQNKTERLFKYWAERTTASIEGNINFYDMQNVAMASSLITGDCFCATRMTLDNPFFLDLKLIEADFIRTPKGKDERYVKNGVQITESGKIKGYYVFQSTKEDHLEQKYKYIRKKENTPNKLIHIFEKERPGQYRGLSLLAGIVEPLHQLSRLSEAELQAAVVTAMLAIFVKKAPEMEQSLAGGNFDTYKEDGDLVNGDSKDIDLDVGSVVRLETGENIETVSPNRPNDAFSPFYEAILKQISASIGISLEVLTMHFTSSYSASRAAMIEAWRTFRQRRAWMSAMFCKPVYESWLHANILGGNIEAPGFLEDPIKRIAWSNASWIGEGPGQINPAVETRASILKIEHHLSNHEREAENLGITDWQTAVNKLRNEKLMLKQYGLLETQEEQSKEDESSENDNVNTASGTKTKEK